MAAAVDDGLTDILMAEGGIGGDDAACQHQILQEFQGRFVFIGGPDRSLVQHAPGSRINHGQEVLGGLKPIPTAAESLAIQRGLSELPSSVRFPEEVVNPAGESLLEGSHVDPHQQLPQAAGCRRPPLEPQRPAKV